MQMINEPLVSIIIPCFNCAFFVTDTLESVLNQNYKNKEILVINDGSTDDSEMILNRYGTKITIIQQQNKGLSEARNSGLAHAKGEFIAFLDSDDYWEHDFLVEMVDKAITGHHDIVYCGWQHVGTYQQPPFVPPDYEKMDNKIELMIESPRWVVHSALLHRRVLEHVNKFDAKWRYCEDFAFWIRAATKFNLGLVPRVLAYYRHHGSTQLSQSLFNMACSHLAVQNEFLAENPEIKDRLGRKTVRRLTYGRLLKKGYELYWQRDLINSRKIFRIVMAHLYGNLNDWKYMLPAILPLSYHEKLIAKFEHDE